MKEGEKVLIIGNGGREHALGWKFKQSPRIELSFANGNAGTAQVGTNIDIEPSEINKIINFSRDNNINSVVVGPEAPLALGLVNEAKEAGIPIFGPTKEAAQLETDKAWAAEFMKRHNIPQPDFRILRDYEEAISFLDNLPWKEIVIKETGLAAGKGVSLPETKGDAMKTFKKLLVDRKSDKVLVQERLYGTEVSIHALADGNLVVPLLPVQDYKRLSEGNRGPNTGGMGSFVPSFVFAETLAFIHQTITKPTIEAMKSEGTPFTGLLYPGIMLTKDGPKVLEYNVRFGDPETQPLMLLLQSDLLPALKATTNGTLNPEQIKFRKGAAVCAVLASFGYPDPEKLETGDLVSGLERVTNGVVVFHAGTKKVEENILTNGGRVLGVTAWGKNLESARRKVYSQIGEQGVHFKGMQYRNDIGR